MVAFSPLLLLFSTCLVSASPAVRRAAQDIEVTLSAPSDAVASIDDLRITAAVTNHGAEEVKLFKYNSVLDDLATESFKVTDANGAPVAFTGMRVSIAPSDASYIAIQPGKTVTVDHAVAALYDFASAGPGSFTFEPLAGFQAPNNGRIAPSRANGVTVEVTDDVSTRSLLPADGDRAVNACADIDKAQFIEASYGESAALSYYAAHYILQHTQDDPKFVGYFGANSRQSVYDRYYGINNEDSETRSLDCTDPFRACGPKPGRNGEIIAYTVIANTNIYYCPIFFQYWKPVDFLCNGGTAEDRIVRGGVTLHEISHALGYTRDYNYGCAGNQNLPDDQKFNNADNYQCFAEEAYAIYGCAEGAVVSSTTLDRKVAL